MDRLETYRNSIIELMRKYKNAAPSCGDVEVQTVFDRENDHYQILNVGWQNDRRVYGCSLHIDIKNGKIWIQHNGTERRIAGELTEMGVPKEDIVLAFHAPYRRQFTGYATN
jgi:hypothetical protein